MKCNRCECEINKDQEIARGLNNIMIHAKFGDCIDQLKSKIKLMDDENKSLRIDYEDIKYLYEVYIKSKNKEKEVFGS